MPYISKILAKTLKKIIDAITRKFFFPADHDILDLKFKIYLEAEAGRLP